MANPAPVIGEWYRRTGGDSFHVALVGADAAQAAIVITRIRSEIAQRVGTQSPCGIASRLGFDGDPLDPGGFLAKRQSR